MHVLGHWSWWAPKPLVWLHDRIGISESDSVPLPTAADPAPGRHRRSDEDPAIPVVASSGAARTAATVVDGR
jgi:RND superfamily putative drug exporter